MMSFDSHFMGSTYFIAKNAYFHDGHAINAEDVVFTFNLLMQQGSPGFKVYYADIKNVEIDDFSRR